MHLFVPDLSLLRILRRRGRLPRHAGAYPGDLVELSPAPRIFFTGGHLPGNKVTGRIAEVRGLAEGEAAVSPSRFPDWEHIDDYRRCADEVREATGGIPIGVKLSAQHIERDIEAALQLGVDYIILDGRGGGTGAAPLLFRKNISVPTIPALARARRYLDQQGRNDVTLVITGGLRLPELTYLGTGNGLVCHGPGRRAGLPAAGS